VSKANPTPFDLQQPPIADAKAVADFMAPDNDPWPDPLELQAELPGVPPFRSEFLPEPLRPLIEEIAASMQVPLDFPGAAMVVALAGVVNRRAIIRPKYLDRAWRETCNLWGCIIGPPGSLKSPVLGRIASPLVKIEREWFDQQQIEEVDFENAKTDIQMEQQLWETSAKAALKDGKPRPPRPDSTIWPPYERRLLTSDSTYESLHQILAQNPAGVFCLRDELSGFLAGLDSEGRQQERPFFLQCWSGSGHHAIDRVGRGHIFVRDTCASLFGALVPHGAVRLVNAVQSGKGDDGFLQRLSVTVWPDMPRDWKWVDKISNETAADGWEGIARALVKLSPADPIVMNFNAASMERFIGWYSDLQAKLRSDLLHASMISHLSKYSKLVPVCAAIFQLAEMADRGELECRAAVEEAYSQRVRRAITLPPEDYAPATAPTEATLVSLPNLERAIALAHYLEGHAQRLYSCVLTPSIRAAHSLARHIRKGDLGPQFSKRDVSRRCWSDLSEPELVDGALQHLSDLNWIRPRVAPTTVQGGRPSGVWLINPKLNGGTK
jgi:hypothetical protein